MDVTIWQVIGFTLTLLLMIVLLQNVQPIFVPLVTVIGSCCLFLFMVQHLALISGAVFGQLQQLNVDLALFRLVMKLVGISLVLQFLIYLLNDCGQQALAFKVEAVGKVFLLAMAFPLMQQLLTIVRRFLQTISF